MLYGGGDDDDVHGGLCGSFDWSDRQAGQIWKGYQLLIVGEGGAMGQHLGLRATD